MKKLEELTDKEYRALDKAGMLYVMYPKATGHLMNDLYSDGISEAENIKNGDWVHTGYDLLPFGRIIHCVGRKHVEVKSAQGSGTMVCIADCTLATPKEIESHLIAEAKRRYPKGTKVKTTTNKALVKVVSDTFSCTSSNNIMVTCEGDLVSPCTMYDGNKWAEIIKEEEIRIGGYEVEFKEGEIKIGCQTISNTDIVFIQKVSDFVLNNGLSLTFHEDGKIEEHTADNSITFETLGKIIDKLK